MSDTLIEDFYEEMKGYDLNTFGLLDSNLRIHTLGTDSKIIGRIFEILTQPVLERIATKYGLLLKTPDSQTVYPDFVLMENERAKNKIAIDIKTTYQEHDGEAIMFTLGSFGSYMRNNTKNIEYKYTDYAKHYVIGFVYQRNGMAQESQVYDLDQRNMIKVPYYNVKYFIQEKYKIAGDKPGSGNTENIGSISTSDFQDFVEGKGPFSLLGDDIYNLYWKYYPKYRAGGDDDYHSLSEFKKWLSAHKNEVCLLKDDAFDDLVNAVNSFLYNLR